MSANQPEEATVIQLEEARVLIVDLDAYSRQMLRDALQMVGFRKVETVAKFGHLPQAIERLDPHLVLLDVDTERPRVCKAIHSIRNRKFGNNPFVTIIALTWKPEKTVVDAVLTAGSDDMLAKPISPNLLRDRVINLINNRKDFVARQDYLGPERATKGDSATPEEEYLPPVAVPNSLRQVAKRDGSAHASDSRISETVRSLCVQKVYRLAREIEEIAGTLTRNRKNEPNRPIPRPAVDRMADMLAQIEVLIAEQEFEHIRQMSESSRGILDRITAAGAGADTRLLELLRMHAQAIMVALKESDATGNALVSALSEAKMAVNA